MDYPVKQGAPFDVIVAGGGPAGISAALASARAGAKTLLLEAGGALGGMATLGLVSKYAPLSDKNGRVIYRGITREIVTRYKTEAEIPEEKWDWIPIYPEVLKRLLDDMAAEAGVTVRFGTRVCGVKQEEGVVKAVLTSSEEGLTEYTAKTYVDATGNGDLAFYAGAPFEDGALDGARQPASLCFVIAGYRKEFVTETLSSNPRDGLWARIKASGKYPLLFKHFIPSFMGEDVILVNGGHLGDVDPADPASLTRAYVLGRKVAAQYLEALKDFLPEAFADAVLVETAPAMGIREGRRIKGDYTLTAEDYLARRRFEDEVTENCYWLDCHGVGGKGKLEVPVEKRHYAPGETHGIPFRCLLPKGLSNVLVAGRCASFDRNVFASTRVMPNCMAMGEAAGLCAALASLNGLAVRAAVPDALKVIQAAK